MRSRARSLRWKARRMHPENPDAHGRAAPYTVEEPDGTVVADVQGERQARLIEIAPALLAVWDNSSIGFKREMLSVLREFGKDHEADLIVRFCARWKR